MNELEEAINTIQNAIRRAECADAGGALLQKADLTNILSLLKAQEPKFVPDIAEAIIGCKPKVKVGHCPSCDVLIHETDKFCRKCGQAVKWDG